MYLKSALLPSLCRIRPTPLLVKRNGYGFGYTVGSNFGNYINVSTSRHMKDMTDKYASSILINSYDQNEQLTYQ